MSIQTTSEKDTDAKYVIDWVKVVIFVCESKKVSGEKKEKAWNVFGFGSGP